MYIEQMSSLRLKTNTITIISDRKYIIHIHVEIIHNSYLTKIGWYVKQRIISLKVNVYFRHHPCQ